ncbi:Ctr copper transporter family-domain-containing protein [Syncephalastrum racemosum]|uniref:Copper transport protein n=1 Tax=Syncephalastrum racemosum TaxID=13706 RepID=A0A1X2H8F7_SYNRA|nr:Ctr copper transporter family-domain-containing protein [Syncephalastrum racemosum]
MDHGHDGHHDMPDMPGMPDMPMCSMNMLFNWQVEDVCVVFEWWHIRTAAGLIASCLAVFAIAAGYEFLRAESAALDQKLQDATEKKRADNFAQDQEAADASTSENQGLLNAAPTAVKLSRQQEMIRSGVYAILVAISFWLMLVFMTYNGYLMIAVVLGAGFGHYFFGQSRLKASRSIQCH